MNTNTAHVFDSNRQIPVTLKRQKIDSTVRFPTDSEIAERQRGIKTVIQKMGQDGTITKVEGLEEADAKLYGKIRVEGPTDLDEADASLIVGRVLKAEAKEAEQEGDSLRIPVVVIGGIIEGEAVPSITTVHTLRIPSEREIRKYRRGAFAFVSKRHGREEMRTNIEAIGDFYDSLSMGREGYAPASTVPVVHKMAAVGELLQAIDEVEADDQPENF